MRAVQKLEQQHRQKYLNLIYMGSAHDIANYAWPSRPRVIQNIDQKEKFTFGDERNLKFSSSVSEENSTFHLDGLQQLRLVSNNHSNSDIIARNRNINSIADSALEQVFAKKCKSETSFKSSNLVSSRKERFLTKQSKTTGAIQI